MTISVDNFQISIRHVDTGNVAVEIIDSVTGTLLYETVPVKELNLDALEQRLLEKIRLNTTKLRDDWGDLYRIGLNSNTYNPYLVNKTQQNGY